MNAEDRIPFPAVPPSDPARCGLVGEHPDMQTVYRLISVAAPTLASVLIVGAPGSGRTVVARCIHRHSPLADGPFLVLRLGALSQQEAEDALFGEEHDTGRGSIARRSGRLEQSRGGTLYLEDIGALSLSTQARLVTALHAPQLERRRHGDARATEFRIIASSQRDPRQSLSEGTFRDDLYFRLAVVTVPIPPLGARGDDILLLLSHFANADAPREAGARPTLTGISAGALHSLEAHKWRTNVSELRALLANAAQSAPGETLRLEDLPTEFQHEEASSAEPDIAKASLAAVEAEHIARVLRETQGMIHQAAAILGVHRNTLTRKIRQYGLEPRDGP